MSLCASCGRERNGAGRFCSGCGAEFRDPTTADEAVPGDTRVEPPAVPPDPFASWYQRQPQVARADAAATWQPTQAVNAAPTPTTGSSSAFTPANPFSSANPVMPPAPPAPPPAGPPGRRGGGRRGLFMTLAVVVVLAAGGGAYALATALGRHSTGRPTAGGSTSAAGSPTGGATRQASSPPASASTTASPTPSLVAVSPGVSAGAAQPAVETLLSHYFQGINSHDYAEYAGTLNPAEQAKQTQAEFDSGYSSTTDSGMTLTGLSATGNGDLTATVTFTSRQSPAQSVDKSACNAWTLNLYLVPQGSGYLIGPAPSGYQPTYSDC